jgi:hypothetical protein
MKRLSAPLTIGLIVALGALALGGVWQYSRQQTTPVAAAATDTVMLFNGCTNVALTWPAGTPLSMVAAAVTPADALESIWRQSIVNDMQVFIAYSPIASAPNDYTSTSSSLEASFICMRAQGSLTRPDR